jgi:hypothetical protein
MQPRTATVALESTVGLEVTIAGTPTSVALPEASSE